MRAASRLISMRACCSLRFPMEISLVGDAAETLRALLPLLEQKHAWRLAKDASRATCGIGGRRWTERAEAAGRSGQSAAGHLGIVTTAAGCAPSSPAIPVPARTGMRAI